MIIRLNLSEVTTAITEYLNRRHKDYAPEEDLVVSYVITGTGDAFAVETEVFFEPKEKEQA